MIIVVVVVVTLLAQWCLILAQNDSNTIGDVWWIEVSRRQLNCFPVIVLTNEITNKETRTSKINTHQLSPWQIINPLDFKGNYSATSNETKLVHWPLMCGLLHLAPPSPLLSVPNVTAQPSTTSVAITVLLYDGPL